MGESMKKLLVTLMLMAMSFQAHATDAADIIGIIGAIAGANNQSDNNNYQPNYPPPGYGVRCEYKDTGWEEHRPHYSCGECLSQHGNCNETCYADTWSCRAVGQ